tara:strand:- start:3142 stop:4137 length:996 start_codon:yes stop_codon:yes gene_type:complete
MNENNKTRVLVVATHGIGDVVMLIPTLVRIVESGSELKIVVKDKTCKEVVEYFLGSSIEFLCLSSVNGAPPMKALRVLKWIRNSRCGVSISQFGVSAQLYSLLVFLGGTKKRYGWYGRLSFLNTDSLKAAGLHKVEENSRFLPLLGIGHSIDDCYVELKCDEARETPTVVLGPGSGFVERHKRWGTDCFAQLANRLVEELVEEVVIIGGGEEVELCNEVERLANNPKVKSLAGEFTVTQTLNYLKENKVVVSNCNGISHLAAAVGCYVVGLYGPTNFSLTGPYSPRATRVSANLDCSPCYRRNYITGCGSPVCMNAITVDMAFDAVKKIVG